MCVYIKSRVLRASTLSYIVLVAPYVLCIILVGLGELFDTGHCNKEKLTSNALIVTFFCLGYIFLCCIWILGFKISIDNRYIVYRNGLFKISKICLLDVVDVRIKYIKRVYIPQHIMFQYMIISTPKNKKALQIYIKPFNGREIHLLQNELQAFCDLRKKSGRAAEQPAKPTLVNR